jgi:hypothetical protein
VDNHSRAQKLLGPWQDALKERVEREVLIEWALRKDEPFEVIAPMKTEENPKPTDVAPCQRIGAFLSVVDADVLRYRKTTTRKKRVIGGLRVVQSVSEMHFFPKGG